MSSAVPSPRKLSAGAGAMRPEISTFLDVLLDEVDYEAMSDFFLTYRAHLRPEDLLDILRAKWQDSSALTRISAHKAKVRIFVALRHWMLNYYPDDFMLAEGLQNCMTQFLNELGGFGADEITTEARIAKELRKSWRRECNIYESIGSSQTAEVEFLKRSVLGIRADMFLYYGLALPTVASMDLMNTGGKRNVARMLRKLRRRDYNGRQSKQPETVQVSDVGLAQESETAYQFDQVSPASELNVPNGVADVAVRRSIPRRSSEIINNFEDRQRQLRGSVIAYSPQLCPPELCPIHSDPIPVRGLRRKPAGILKNNYSTQELVANRISRSRRSSSVSSYGESLPNGETKWQNLRASLPPRRAEQVAEATTDEFLKRLIEMFENESASDEDTPSVARQKALDKLEGRTGSAKKRKSTLDLQRTSVHGSDEEAEELEDCGDIRSSNMGSEKRRRRVAIVPCMDDALITFASPLQLYSECILDADDLENQTVVSLVEALDIPKQLRPAQDFSRRLYPERPYSSWLLSCNTAHLAQALSKIEKLCFLELDWLELASGLWINSSTQALSLTIWQQVISQNVVGVNLILARFNCAVSWFVSEITKTEALEFKVSTVSKLIEIAVLCKSYNNFTTVMQVIQALKSQRLKGLKFWSKVPRPTMRQWKAIESLCDKRSNWRLLGLAQDRAMLNPDATVVPFLGIYLSRLLAIEQSTDPIIPKLRATAGVTKLLLNMLDRIAAEDLSVDDGVDEDLVRRLVWIGGDSRSS